MPIARYRYVFREDVPAEEVEAALCLALIGTESLHGEVQARLDIGHYLDTSRRQCVIEANTPSGADLNRLFAGFLTREFGAETFHVERIDETDNSAMSSQPKESSHDKQ